MSIQHINEQAAVFGQNEGPLLEVVTPDGFTIGVREWNAEDEDTISKLTDNKDGTATYKFLAAIVQTLNGVPVRLTWQDVAKWRLRSIYYALFKSRVLTYGYDIVWEHTFESEDGKDDEVATQVENMKKYDFDLSKGVPPKRGETNYSPNVIQPYISTTEWVESQTSTGIKYRWKHRTGEDELAQRDMDINALSVNDKLRVRSFQVPVNGQWQQVERFNFLKARDANEIRNRIDDLDHEFQMLTVAKSPKGKREPVSLFQIPTFYYPQS
jgi:hypothetical protein